MAELELADRVKKIPPSATMATAIIAADYAKKGITHYHFGLGEPDGGLWWDLKEAGQEAFNEGHTVYTPTGGSADVKKGICDFFNYFELNYMPENVMGGSGSKGILYEALLTLVNPGDEVLVPVPYWVSYIPMIELVGGKPVLIQPGENNKITPEALEAAITPKTKMIIFNNPSNPSGAFYDQAEIEGLASVLRKHDRIAILTDDMYWSFIYSDKPYVSFAAVARDLAHRTLTSNGLAKSHRMTGLRWGFVGGPAGVIKAMEGKVQSNIAGNPSSIAQRVALNAFRYLQNDQGRLQKQRVMFMARRDAMVDLINDMGIECDKPEGAFYVFPNVSQFFGKKTGGTVIKNDVDLANYLATDAKVILVPGSAFGAPNSIRLAYPVDIEKTIIPGMKAMHQSLMKLHS